MKTVGSRLTASLGALALTLLAAPATAAVSLELDPVRGEPPSLFSDNMVLQRETDVPIWGKADPGESVSVTIAGQTKMTTTDPDGRWRVALDPMPAGGPHEMTIAGSNTIVVAGVLIGDVWICAGQSNLVVRRPRLSALLEYPEIRTLGKAGHWKDRPSGMAFAFAQELVFATGVPIGLINRAAGGTTIRNWLAPAARDDPDPDVQAIIGGWDNFSDAYNRHLAPMAGFAVRGVLYWQGEQDLKLSRQDSANVDHYFHLLPALIRSWRLTWQRGNIPFVLVQLPTGGGILYGQTPTALPAVPPETAIGVQMRQSTFNGLSEPATSLMVSVDIIGAIHPKDRELYGYRLANAALGGAAYGQSFAYSGPIYSSMTVEDAGRVRLRFRANTAEGLYAAGAGVQGFSISPDGENFVWANAEIQNNEVVVWNDAVPTPAVVRYAWDRRPTWANLFNGANLGAAPFSTTSTPAP